MSKENLLIICSSSCCRSEEFAVPRPINRSTYRQLARPQVLSLSRGFRLDYTLLSLQIGM